MFKPIAQKSRKLFSLSKGHFDGDVSENTKTRTDVKMYTQSVSKLREEKYMY